MRIAFLGADNPLSTHTLHAMAHAGLRPDVIVRFGQAPLPDSCAQGLALAQPDALDEVVRRLSLPGPLWARGSAALEQVVAPRWPDLVICACFPSRISPAVLDQIPLGVINVHPSLLPAFRGPAPLFWQLRRSLTEVGLSIHRMVPKVDAGPVLARKKFAVAQDMRLEHIEAALGDLAGRTLAKLVAAGLGPGEAQDERRAGYQSWPTDRDYCLSPLWSAVHGYRFIRAVAAPGVVFTIQIMGESFALERVLACEQDTSISEAFVIEGGSIAIRMNPGVLVARLARAVV